MKVRTKVRSGTAPSLLQPLTPRPQRPALNRPDEAVSTGSGGLDGWIETGF